MAQGLGGSWRGAAALVTYALAFSLAYGQLGTGTGALLLFGAVQVTMILAALSSGERPGPLQWAGLALALGGLVYLVLPGLAAPAPLGGVNVTIQSSDSTQVLVAPGTGEGLVEPPCSACYTLQATPTAGAGPSSGAE